MLTTALHRLWERDCCIGRKKKTEDTVYRDYFISLSGLENLNVFHLHVQHPFLLLVCFALTAMAAAVLGPKRLRIEIIPNCTTGTNYR